MEITSLTGVGGLIKDTQVFTVTPLGATTRITVRDFVPIDDLASRFMRLKIEKVDL